MALTNFITPAADASTVTPVEYVNMCIGNSRTCAELTRNLCVTSIFASPYASSTTTGGVCIFGNNLCPNVFEMNMVVPKGNCLSGSCTATFHGYFFG